MKTKKIGIIQLIIGIIILVFVAMGFLMAYSEMVPGGEFIGDLDLIATIFAVFTAIPNLKSKK